MSTVTHDEYCSLLECRRYLVCLKVKTKGESSTSVFLFLVASPPFKSPLAAEDGREVDGLPLFFPWDGNLLMSLIKRLVKHKSLGVHLRCHNISIVHGK